MKALSRFKNNSGRNRSSSEELAVKTGLFSSLSRASLRFAEQARPACFCTVLCCIGFSLTLSAHAAKQNSAETGPCSAGYAALSQKDHKKALELFNGAARDYPDSVQAHYGRAMALKELGRKDEAIKEFKLTLLLNAPEDINRSCKEKITALEAHKTEANKAESHAHDAHIHSQPNSAPTTVHPQDVESSINKILKQSEEKIGSMKANSEVYADRIYSARSDAHNRLMEQARQEADEMRRAHLMFGRRMIPMFSEAEIMQRQAEIQYKSAYALERARADYEARKLEAQNRALSLRESAEGLESQMISRPAETSGVFLVPQGTNLYVRNYGHFDPILPEPPEPLHAVPLKMPQMMNKQIKPASKKESGDSKSSAASDISSENSK